MPPGLGVLLTLPVSWHILLGVSLLLSLSEEAMIPLSGAQVGVKQVQHTFVLDVEQLALKLGVLCGRSANLWGRQGVIVHSMLKVVKMLYLIRSCNDTLVPGKHQGKI